MTDVQTVAQEAPPFAYDPETTNIAVRMADEGIPVRAIARATKIPSDDLRDILEEAIARGGILSIPNDDWPVGTARAHRTPSIVSMASLSDELLDIYIGKIFKATRLEAAVLIPLIKRPEVNRDGLHQSIEDRRTTATDQTDPKMVDVVICKLRKKLELHSLSIVTNWSRGYEMPIADRKRAAAMIMEYANRES